MGGGWNMRMELSPGVATSLPRVVEKVRDCLARIAAVGAFPPARA